MKKRDPRRIAYTDWVKLHYGGKPGFVHTEYAEIGVWLEQYEKAEYKGVVRCRNARPYLRYWVEDMEKAFELMREALWLARAKRWSLTPA